MVTGIWGRKIGMTQIFAQDKVFPVTAIDLSHWLITNIKYTQRDGYDAVQVGNIRKRYKSMSFSPDWIKDSKKYFSALKEIPLNQPLENIKIGDQITADVLLSEGEKVDVYGITKGLGFAGCVRRHNFNGPPGSHGSTMGKGTGSIGFRRRSGSVIKGKKMPGHMGTTKSVMRNLSVVKMEQDAQLIFVKGSIPGKGGSVVFVRKV